jgi:hypothetical protein
MLNASRQKKNMNDVASYKIIKTWTQSVCYKRMEGLFISTFMYTAAYNVENNGDFLAFFPRNIECLMEGPACQQHTLWTNLDETTYRLVLVNGSSKIFSGIPSGNHTCHFTFWPELTSN